MMWWGSPCIQKNSDQGKKQLKTDADRPQQIYGGIFKQTTAINQRKKVNVMTEKTGRKNSSGIRDGSQFYYSLRDWDKTGGKKYAALIWINLFLILNNASHAIVFFYSFFLLACLLWWLFAGWLQPPDRCMTCMDRRRMMVQSPKFKRQQWSRSQNRGKDAVATHEWRTTIRVSHWQSSRASLKSRVTCSDCTLFERRVK